MKKEYFIILGIIIVFEFILIILFVPKENKQKIEKTNIKQEEKTIKKETTNTKQQDMSFVPNQLMVFFERETTYEEIEKIMKEIDAYNETGKENSINMYAFTFNNREFKTSDEIKKYCEELMNKYKNIVSCSQNTYNYID